MEVTGDSDNLKNRSLTPVRTLRGLIILLIFLSTAFMFLIYFAPPFALALRLLSVHQSRKSISFIFGHWLALWPYLFETINGTTVIFSGDTLPVEKRVLLIANHRTEVDWMYLWNIALRKGCLGYIKYVLKSSLMRLPIFGWGFHVLEFIPVERKREVDEPVMLQMLSSFKDPREPLWLALFPEGTDFTEEKCKRSQKFAAEAGLPTLSNVLLPKTRGFSVCLDALHNSLDAVYDLTIAYKPRCPSFMDNVFGTDPSEVHIHVKRVLTKEIPASEAESSAWLMDSFKSKDRLLSDFNAQGQFPNQRPEEELSILKCIATFGVIVSLTLETTIGHQLFCSRKVFYITSKESSHLSKTLSVMEDASKHFAPKGCYLLLKVMQERRPVPVLFNCSIRSSFKKRMYRIACFIYMHFACSHVI
ncbi:hypothetical protein Bca4012_050298 [Brassica carinata]